MASTAAAHAITTDDLDKYDTVALPAGAALDPTTTPASRASDLAQLFAAWGLRNQASYYYVPSEMLAAHRPSLRR